MLMDTFVEFGIAESLSRVIFVGKTMLCKTAHSSVAGAVSQATSFAIALVVRMLGAPPLLMALLRPGVLPGILHQPSPTRLPPPVSPLNLMLVLLLLLCNLSPLRLLPLNLLLLTCLLLPLMRLLSLLWGPFSLLRAFQCMPPPVDSPTRSRVKVCLLLATLILMLI